MFPFNKDQLNGLAKLCFDLAKGSFILSTTSPISSTPADALLSGAKSLLLGLAFTYAALILLKLKEQNDNR